MSMNSKLISPFGKRLRKFRIDTGITQAEMAKALGYSSSFLSNLELGKVNATKEMIDKLLTTFESLRPFEYQLRKLASESQARIDIHTYNLSLDRRKLLSLMAANITHLSDFQVKRFIDSLNHVTEK
jgi:transcriptional regulator with XRE-family HTH domain